MGEKCEIDISGSGESNDCDVNQECINFMECPYTRSLFVKANATRARSEQDELIKSIQDRICGQRSERTVCCVKQQNTGKGCEKLFII